MWPWVRSWAEVGARCPNTSAGLHPLPHWSSLPHWEVIPVSFRHLKMLYLLSKLSVQLLLLAGRHQILQIIAPIFRGILLSNFPQPHDIWGSTDGIATPSNTLVPYGSAKQELLTSFRGFHWSSLHYLLNLVPGGIHQSTRTVHCAETLLLEQLPLWILKLLKKVLKFLKKLTSPPPSRNTPSW